MAGHSVSSSRITLVVILLCASMGLWSAASGINDSRYVRAVAVEAAAKAGAETDRDRIIAMRDYLRTHVTSVGVRSAGRPFLRDSAAETLRKGNGFCGEVSRAFVIMAFELGIPARRLNLYGRSPHVVAEAKAAPHHFVVVDSQSPPLIADLESLDEVIRRFGYTDHYTLNLRRFHLDRLLPRVSLDAGPLTYWLEQPDLIRATGWFGLGAFLIVVRLFRRTVSLVRGR